MPARKTAEKAPAEPLPNQICGVITPDGMCNLKPGHEGDHQRIDPKTEDVDVAAAAQQVFGEDSIERDAEAQRPVIVKLARIMGSLPELKPEGHNQHFNYDFIKDTQISGALRSRLANERVMIIPDVIEESWVETKTARGGTSWVTKLKVHFTAIDGDSGDSISGHGFGYGDDTGDKGANKAFTAALKYWLIKLFQIGGEDLEADTRADERAAARQAGSAADHGVQVEGRQISGVQRGGRSETITRAQAQRIGQLSKDLELTPEALAERISKYLPAKLVLPEEGDVQNILKGALATLSGDDAGSLISDLVDEKDQANEEPGGGYG